ncbi:MAG: hypothetical protein IJX97_04100 [Clostridia bacterium]|nr:hypothetical protein [Clostridia bacterium]MBQ8720076.1 hypothetical protein [Clostridia bacterium]
MSGLSDYAVSIVAIVGAAALAAFVSYKSELSPAVKGATALIIAATVAIPIGELISSLTLSPPSIEDFVGEESYEYEAVGREAFEKGVALLIAERYGLDEGGVRVRCAGFDFESMTAERIEVILSGKAIGGDFSAIESYISSLGIGECNVEIEI